MYVGFFLFPLCESGSPAGTNRLAACLLSAPIVPVGADMTLPLGRSPSHARPSIPALTLWRRMEKRRSHRVPDMSAVHTCESMLGVQAPLVGTLKLATKADGCAALTQHSKTNALQITTRGAQK
jgi:hypothetical protein